MRILNYIFENLENYKQQLSDKDKWLEENKDYKLKLLEDAQQYSTSLNRSTLLIATGAISVSIIFIEPKGGLIDSVFLITAWVLFVLSMFFSCLEYLFIKSAIKHRLKATDIILHEKKATLISNRHDKKGDWKSGVSELSIYLSMLFLLSGIISLLYFSYQNLV